MARHPDRGLQAVKPLICAVEGWCVGGAIVLGMMCDLMVCGATAKFYYPEAKLGLTGGMIAGLASRVPHKIAMEMAMLCTIFSAERAERVGLVNEVVPEGQALARAMEVAIELCGMAPMVLAEIKRMVTEDIMPRGPSEQMAIQASAWPRSAIRRISWRASPPSAKSARRISRGAEPPMGRGRAAGA